MNLSFLEASDGQQFPGQMPVFCGSPRDRQLARHMVCERSGVTLIEMLLATVILVVAMSALAQQSAVGIRSALRSELETESGLRCQSVVSELSAHTAFRNATTQTSHFEDDERWVWRATVQQSGWSDLLCLQVEVFQKGPHEDISRTQMSRLVPNMQVRQGWTDGGPHR